MKKLTYILALCLCLNGTPVLAAEVENPAATAPAAQQVEQQPTEQEAARPAQTQAEEPSEGENGEAQKPAGENIGEKQEGSSTPSGDGQQGGFQEGGSQEGGSQEGGSQQGGSQEGGSQEGGSQEGGSQEGGSQEGGSQEGGGESQSAAEARYEETTGALEALLAQISGKGTIYLRVDKKSAVCVKAAPLKKLSELTFEADKEIFKEGETAYISTEAPDATTAKTLVDPADYKDEAEDATGTLYFWVEKKDQYQDETEPEPDDPVQPQISVIAENCVAGQWSCEIPTFTLSGIPEGKNYTYAAIVYGERIIPLSGDTYTPGSEGQYEVRFAIMDGIGDFVSLSDTYALWLDVTQPEEVNIETDDTKDYTINLTAVDSLSGVAGISIDGGETWTTLENSEVFTYTAPGKTTLGPGVVQIKDAAGNILSNLSDIELDAVSTATDDGGYGGYGGYGGGGSGEKKPAPSHASGDGEEGAEYETVALELPEEPMTKLTVGGETMDLTLVLDAAQAEGAPVGEGQPFTAQLRSWCPKPAGEDARENILNNPDEPRQDTLLLTAVPIDGLGDEFTYTWRFNGEVYRLLANSGIRYVALQIGDDMVAFPTEGFTGGTKYTELKMLGVSTRKFDYTLTMRVNRDPGYVSALSDSDFSLDCDLSIRAEVENMAYELSGSTNSIMYFYDVYLGPEAMLSQPFGDYKA